MQGKGLEVLQGDPRAIKAYGLGNAVATRGRRLSLSSTR